MSISAPRSEQAAARFAEAQNLADKGFRERAVESLHAAAELAVDEIAEREAVEIPHEQLGWHEARARASVRLRQLGFVPAGFDNLLRRLNDDRKRTKYDDKPTRFDPLTFAQAQASVRIVIESLGVALPSEPPEAAPPAPEEPTAEASPQAPEAPAPPPEAPAPPPPEAPAAAPPVAERPSRRPAVAIAAAIGLTAAVLVIVGLIAFQAGEERKSPRKPRRPAGTHVVAYGATARVARLAMSVDTARTGPRVGRPPLPSKRGTYVLVNLRVSNPTDRTLPLRFDAFRLKGGTGRVFRPSVGLTQFTLAIDPGKRQSLPLPFDVPTGDVRGAQLLADITSPSGARRRPGATFDLGLGDGLGELMPGTWKGKTSEGRPFTMKIEKGDVVRRIRFSAGRGRSCTISFQGAAFVEGGRFRAGSEAAVTGAFSSSVAASGTATSTPASRCNFGTIGWRASTTLR